jgi:glycosyltransferase involved in cell wall biosynthesis
VDNNVQREEKQPRISLVIPAYNEENYLGATIENVKAAIAEYENQIPGSNVELIVVNNNSTDNTEQVAKDLGAQVVFEKKNQIAASRNAGGRVAKGDIVAFLDADDHVSSNIFILIDEVMSSGIYIGGGAKIIQETLSPVVIFFHIIFEASSRMSGISPGIIYLHKSTFDKMGGFDEEYYAGEEGFFLWELKRLGRLEGKKLCVIRKGHVIKSTRTYRMLGSLDLIWGSIKFTLNPKRSKDKKKCHIWYDVGKR